MNEQGTYWVIAARERLPDFSLVTEIIAGFLGLNRDDAAKAARHSWGFLGENLAAEKAEELLRKCSALGVEAVKLPAVELHKLEVPLQITRLAPGPEALSYTEANGKSGLLLKGQLRVLSAAPIR